MACGACVCLGLRISECLALKCSDVDRIKSRLNVERGIVRQRVADTKTQGSKTSVACLLELLNAEDLEANHGIVC